MEIPGHVMMHMLEIMMISYPFTTINHESDESQKLKSTVEFFVKLLFLDEDDILKGGTYLSMYNNLI